MTLRIWNGGNAIYDAKAKALWATASAERRALQEERINWIIEARQPPFRIDNEWSAGGYLLRGCMKFFYIWSDPTLVASEKTKRST